MPGFISQKFLFFDKSKAFSALSTRDFITGSFSFLLLSRKWCMKSLRLSRNADNLSLPKIKKCLLVAIIQVLLISYLLFWPPLIWQIFLEKKKSAGCLLKTKWQMKKQKKKICVPVKMQTFICHFVFRRQPAEFLFSKKNCLIKAGQIKNIEVIPYLKSRQNVHYVQYHYPLSGCPWAMFSETVSDLNSCRQTLFFSNKSL